MSGFGLLLHHSESIDPTLLDWIRHEIDAIFGLDPSTIVLVLGTLIVAFPVVLMVLARRQQRGRAGTKPEPGAERRRAIRRRRARLG
jgi:hypothetical protein